jgi:catechol 2,3-dioxygenase-like lactoylglutathione lyase family enzyme
MIDHTGVVASDFSHSKTFYRQALQPLGHVLMKEFPAAVTGSVDVAGFGPGDIAGFWIHAGSPKEAVHIAFKAPSRAAVREFYEAAMAAGGRDNGAPGPRPHYHPDYYAAFVLDPDGHNIEAVCRTPGEG